MLRVQIAFWRLYYRARDALRCGFGFGFDDAWERDVAMANAWARRIIWLKIAIGAAFFAWLFSTGERWAIDAAMEGWRQ